MLPFIVLCDAIKLSLIQCVFFVDSHGMTKKTLISQSMCVHLERLC